MEISQALSRLKAWLEPVSDTASLDAQVLLAHVLGRPRSWVMAHPEAALSPEQQADLEKLASRLETGEPLPYVLGHWEFFGLDFLVTPAVLIPRPETELLVDQAIKWLQLHPVRRRAAEVGTGSGCIAVSLARNLPGLRLLASDLSWPALQVARANALRHHVAGQVDFILCDLLPGAHASFDLICANLPYIPTEELRKLKVSLWEPGLALDGGPDGLVQYRRLLSAASSCLSPGGLMLLEIEASLGAAALSLARKAFPQASPRVLPDLAGRDRLIIIETT